MSDLKWQDREKLEESRRACLRLIDKYKTCLEGERQRLIWIDKYIFEKTPQELTLRDVEARLGHKVILKPEPEPWRE